MEMITCEHIAIQLRNLSAVNCLLIGNWPYTPWQKPYFQIQNTETSERGTQRSLSLVALYQTVGPSLFNL